MTYDKILTAIADPTRQTIIELMRDGPKTVGALGRRLPVSRPAVSQHLKVLSDAGLLEVQPSGTRRYYRLSPEGIAAVRTYLDQLWNDAMTSFKDYADGMKEPAKMADFIEKIIDVPLIPDQAFALFTEHLAEWWPGDTHSLSAATRKTPKDIEVELYQGGLIIEHTADGNIAPWGRFTEFKQGKSLSIDWFVGRPEAEATQIEVKFQPTAKGTRITLTHGGWDVLGPNADRIRDSYQGGWDHVLVACFGSAADAAAIPQP